MAYDAGFPLVVTYVVVGQYQTPWELLVREARVGVTRYWIFFTSGLFREQLSRESIGLSRVGYWESNFPGSQLGCLRSQHQVSRFAVCLGCLGCLRCTCCTWDGFHFLLMQKRAPQTLTLVVTVATGVRTMVWDVDIVITLSLYALV